MFNQNSPMFNQYFQHLTDVNWDLTYMKISFIKYWLYPLNIGEVSVCISYTAYISVYSQFYLCDFLTVFKRY